MRQIPLDLNAVEAPSFDNYVTGNNHEPLALLRALAAGPPPPAASAWLWGEPGTGKTHLTRALAAAIGEPAVLLGPQADVARFDVAIARFAAEAEPGVADGPAEPGVAEGPEGPAGAEGPGGPGEPRGPVVIIDDCDRLDPARQEAAFHLYNLVRAAPPARFVATGAQPPLALALREDLRTRLGWGAVLRLTLLTDEEKAEALRRSAGGRGLALPDELIRYLLTQRSRDIRWLLHRLDALDRFALERKRPVTLPLLRELESSEPLPAACRTMARGRVRARKP